MSTPRTFGFVLVGLLATVWFAVGCGSSANPGVVIGDAGTLRPYEPDASDAGYAVAAFGPSEAATAVAPADQGSPLCNASPYVGGCYPDLPTTAQACGYDLSEGGASTTPALAIDTPLGCYVQMTPDAGLEPTCAPAGPGVDGASCSEGTDCAPGLECVGQGTCRHYCCAGNTACDLDEFCDIQPTTQNPGTMVPVCMPQTPCALLEEGACPSGEACQVVRENGATSCVTVGPAHVGDDCDTDHCAAGLVCIGATGARRCYTLCHTVTMVECAQGQTCTGGLPLFTDPTVGWCH
jgi:hypothetical protein